MKPFLIGIAAPTCAGKTSIADALQKKFKDALTILSFDEYDLVPSGSVLSSKIVNWEDPKLFDYEQFLKDLRRLKQGKPISVSPQSRESIAKGIKKKRISPTQLVLIEGIFVFHEPQAREMFDLRFYIDLPPQEMVKRRLTRPRLGNDPWNEPAYVRGQMVRGTKQYVLPQKRYAHVVLNGLLSRDILVKQIIDEIRKKMRELEPR